MLASSLINPAPSVIFSNSDHQYSLINSIDFHPQKNLFCITCTHNNKVDFVEIDSERRLHIVQSLRNPQAELCEPQHAVFSPDGETLIVANWTNQVLTLYARTENGLFSQRPFERILPPEGLKYCRPHGMTISPCGNFLAIAYGAASYYGRGLALFQKQDGHFRCVSVLKSSEIPGIPKGITFSPDGKCLWVTFCDVNSLNVFSIQDQTIHPIPKQTVQGPDTQLSRPEDIKISPDGCYLAVTNSDQNTVTFYLYDAKSNVILQNTPHTVLKNPESNLSFPHGIAFSSDGHYFAVTQFGGIQVTQGGDICWHSKMKSNEAKINIYTVESK